MTKKKSNAPDISEREINIFKALDPSNQSYVTPKNILDALESMGILKDDLRIKPLITALKKKQENSKIELDEFCQLISSSIEVVEHAIQGNMVIPDFQEFTKDIEQIFHKTQSNKSGSVANYIPQLGRVNPEQYAVSVCTVDGQRHSIGDHDVDFCVQSCSKPITYCLALEEHGEDLVHQYIGREPSGRGFNELTLNHEGKPHNPMINSGAIMSCSLLRPDLDVADRFDYVMEKWKALAGGRKVGFNNSVYLSERTTADRNFALSYYMRENKAFPDWADMLQVLEFYFQVCSIDLNADQMSIIAGTLANGGVCPVTNERVFAPRTVQNCLSLMYSCGMYDFSGEFAFSIGLPAKSGVAGALLIVIPNVMGICTWSPRLDKLGNSVRGIDFCQELVQTFNFHNYDNLTGLTEKKDPRQNDLHAFSDQLSQLMWAASKGDLSAILRLESKGVDLSLADYDGRTPIHLAASEGHAEVVSFFIDRKINLNPKDRWGGTPLMDAKRHNHDAVTKLLKENGAK
ncbi:MAG: glutaminase A [Myxococcota bacterium]|nr:glutaminase A [Myxococcota bacterium]